ncbi:MAG TPA: class I SAM-dependent methyltransferase [Phycisphaerae bacterium]|nr:class I SAM-dependent methyltransferase [Phycisphaerae bacterium]HRY70812.1 class I SAM-dependent methyltransferase [Phycisphaerae bacterium]HSA28317.1 class I SAM-dependent methyltransferase [Phycisphaerae bacterium]
MACTCTENRSFAEALPAPASGHPYLDRLRRHRRMWDSKPAVRAQYRYWYRLVTAQLANLSPSIELGCGCGNFKGCYPEVLATDAMPTPWCDRVVDACHMNFEDDSVGNLVMFDVLHHIPEPLRVFEEASRVLRPSGRIVVVEPLLTAWSRIVYRFHHESIDETSDLFNVPAPPPSSADYANAATATLFFHRHREAFLQHVPRLRWVSDQAFSCLAYPLTGGFRPFCLIPACAVNALSRAEGFVISRWRCRFLALRTLIVLEKRE